MIDNQETQGKIAVEVRDLSRCTKHKMELGDFISVPMPTVYGKPLDVYYAELADRIDAVAKREADSIERLVRDAIIDYQEMYSDAPNDEAERDLVERAERGNAWLVAHGYEPEQLSWGKEELPCL